MSILDSNLQQISEEKISEMQLQKMIEYCGRHTPPLTYGAAFRGESNCESYEGTGGKTFSYYDLIKENGVWKLKPRSTHPIFLITTNQYPSIEKDMYFVEGTELYITDQNSYLSMEIKWYESLR